MKILQYPPLVVRLCSRLYLLHKDRKQLTAGSASFAQQSDVVMSSVVTSVNWKEADLRWGREGHFDTRSQIASLRDAGFQNIEIARILGFSRSIVCNLVKRYNAHGSIENRPRTERQKSFTARDATRLSRVSTLQI